MKIAETFKSPFRKQSQILNLVHYNGELAKQFSPRIYT